MFHKNNGFGAIETIVATAMFLVIGLSIYQIYIKAFQVAERARTRTMMATLTNEEIEKIRNLPYAQIGVQLGIPSGNLLPSRTLQRGTYQFLVNTTIRNYDDPFDGQLGSTTNNDLSPADSKIVEIGVSCLSCRIAIDPVIITTRVGPKTLESASTNGALFIKVLDASGLPIEGAEVRIVNASSSVLINDVTNTQGKLQIIDAPPGVEAYQVTATKPGYTTERTYQTGSTTAPNPVKRNPTVLVQDVTELTLVIDRKSTLNVFSTRSDCSPIPAINFTLSGTRLISTLPDVLKYSKTLTTDLLGQASITDLEWDNYALQVNSATYDLTGTIPLPPLTLSPGSTQNLYLVMKSASPNMVSIGVKDGGSQLPIADAKIELVKQTPYSTTTLYTGRGFLRQTDWSGASAIATTSNDGIDYWAQSSLDVVSSPGLVTLLNEFGAYRPSGWLESSTFDTGSPGNFYEISVLPVNQPTETGNQNLRLQFASGNDGTATSGWSFLGPDGTNATYYTATSTTISSTHNGNRYFRYKSFFDTASTTYTPTMQEISVTFSSGCVPPGQAFFDGLSSGLYDVYVSKSGYNTATDSVNITPAWQNKEINLYP